MNRFFQPAITAVLLSAALVVIAVTLLSGSVAQGAATYTKTDWTSHPIMDIYGNPHSYSGNDLEPFVNLEYANLEYANLTDAIMYNADMSNAYLTGADLSGAYLYGVWVDFAILTGADLSDTNLDHAYLDYANLTDVNLTGATLEYALLEYADLTGANLTNANLTNANLTGVYLYNADLSGANLYSANLEHAFLYSTTFSFGTTLYDGQTVLQHGFDTAGLRAYLEASPFNASSAYGVILVPEPHTLLLASLASMGLTLRRRRSAR